jgi:hypothetical protein
MELTQMGLCRHNWKLGHDVTKREETKEVQILESLS